MQDGESLKCASEKHIPDRLRSCSRSCFVAHKGSSEPMQAAYKLVELGVFPVARMKYKVRGETRQTPRNQQLRESRLSAHLCEPSTGRRQKASVVGLTTKLV